MTTILKLTHRSDEFSIILDDGRKVVIQPRRVRVGRPAVPRMILRIFAPPDVLITRPDAKKLAPDRTPPEAA